MRYEVYLTRKAKKDLDELDPKIRRRVLEALTMLRDYGFTPRLDIKKLRGYRTHYRLRIGEYRILFELEKPRRVIVHAILPRKQAYRQYLETVGQDALAIFSVVTFLTSLIPFSPPLLTLFKRTLLTFSLVPAFNLLNKLSEFFREYKYL